MADYETELFVKRFYDRAKARQHVAACIKNLMGPPEDRVSARNLVFALEQLLALVDADKST